MFRGSVQTEGSNLNPQHLQLKVYLVTRLGKMPACLPPSLLHLGPKSWRSGTTWSRGYYHERDV